MLHDDLQGRALAVSIFVQQSGARMQGHVHQPQVLARLLSERLKCVHMGGDIAQAAGYVEIRGVLLWVGCDVVHSHYITALRNKS